MTLKTKRAIKKAAVTITPIKGGFKITSKPCSTCGEPPFGGEYCCGHMPTETEDELERARR